MAKLIPRFLKNAIKVIPAVRTYHERSRTLEGQVRALKDVEALTHPSYPRWESVIPLPHPVLINTTGKLSLEQFLVVGEAWNQVVSRFIVRRDSTVLDIGCGCGKTARFLVSNPFVGRYIGFDVMRENVEWCMNFISPFSRGRFGFRHYDIYSATYNRLGQLQASEFVFPAADGTVDLAIAASLFTHLLEHDAQHYLYEIRRVLKRDGVAIVSIHVTPPPGMRYSGDEGRIDVEPEYFLSLASAVDLRLAENLGDLCGQQALALACA
jgi:SAM-dependent methyltransferase